jgi:hypothetical protein
VDLAGVCRDNVVFLGSLVQRADYDAVGGFRPQFRGTEDWDLWIRLARRGVRFTSAGHPTVLYRLTPGSLSSEDRLVGQELAVLDTAAGEAATPEERAAVAAGIRRLRAQQRLFEAYSRAAAGSPWAARVMALGALRGSRRVALRGAAMAAAPRAVARRRSAARAGQRG